MSHEAVIVDVIRTPVGRGKPGGQLSGVHPVDLAAGMLQSILGRNGLDSEQIDDVLLGCVSQVGDQAMNIAANEHAARTLDGFLQPGAFVRLREASLQYTFSPEITRRIVRGRSLSIIATGRNLALWTNYRGVDPESAFNTTSGTEAPSEFQTIGPPSYLIFRVNLGF